MVKRLALQQVTGHANDGVMFDITERKFSIHASLLALSTMKHVWCGIYTMTCLSARDNSPTTSTGVVKVDTALFWNWVHHLDVVYVVGSQLSCLGRVVKT